MSSYSKEPSAWSATNNGIQEKSRGISLRKKRTVKPKISAPRQISGPITTNVPGGSNNLQAPTERPGSSLSSDFTPRPRLRERPTNGPDETADMLKRRFSMKYTGNIDFTAEPPPMPTLPGGSVPPSRDGPRPSFSAGAVKVDASALKDPNLKADQYVQSILGDASAQEIASFQNELRKAKTRASVDLQASVFQNRTQFIKISQEAEKVKSELRTLRTLIGDLTSTLGQTATTTGTPLPGTDSLSARRHANRSSVANLEALWNTHLQALWKRVEGSQKYLPASPGRHIVYESGRWVELDAATWKPRRRVHLIILNDHLLIATEKKRLEANTKEKSQGPTQLIATKCFPLSDVQVADLAPVVAKDRGATQATNTANAINVRVGAESFTFATGSSEANEKAALLTTFRRAAEELRKAREAESLLAPTQQPESTSNMLKRLSGRDLGILRNPDLISGLASEGLGPNTANREVQIEIDGKTQNLRWLEMQLDELDIDVALQRFEEAVDRVELLRRVSKSGIKGFPALQTFVLQKVGDRAGKLSQVLLRSLADSHSWMGATKQNVDWLARLGFEDRARQCYLDARGQVLKKRLRQCIFDGDLHIYIYQLSYITFTILRDTITIFQYCFGNANAGGHNSTAGHGTNASHLSSTSSSASGSSAQMSACISWCKTQVDSFNEILTRQLSSVDPESRTYGECLERVRVHAGMVREVGVDFGGLVAKGL